MAGRTARSVATSRPHASPAFALLFTATPSKSAARCVSNVELLEQVISHRAQ